MKGNMSSDIANLFPAADVVGDASSSSASDVASSSDMSIKQMAKIVWNDLENASNVAPPDGVTSYLNDE